MSLEKQAIPKAELFEAIDRRHSPARRDPQRGGKIPWHAALPGHNDNRVDHSTAGLDGGRQCRQQGRFTSAMRAGDLPLPAVRLEGIDKFLNVFPLFEDEIDRARP